VNAIEWNIKAIKQLRKLPQNMQRTIRDNVSTLTDFRNNTQVKALQNHRYDYRLRVGRYRVFFNYDGEIKIVAIMEVKKRDERTY
jgi:mRNA-degrading endonuclease RelE of RelBE toxin-antitoxin system